MSISVARTLWTRTALVAVDEFNQRYPDLSWGTYNGHHPTEARASDGMVPRWQTAAGKARGWEVARWIRANAVRLRVWYVIFDGKIWSRTRPEAGWAPYTPTAKAIANSPASAWHRNHVHVSFYDMEPASPPKPVTYLPPYLVDPAKVTTTLWAVHPVKEDVERPPLFRITTAVDIKTIDGRRWLETEAGYLYDLDFVVLETVFKARPPTPVVAKPVPDQAGVDSPPPVKPEPAPPAPQPQLVVELDAPGSGNWQCAVDTADHWYLAEARQIGAGDDEEDAIFHRFPKVDGAAKLTQSEACTLAGGEHPTSFAVSDTGVVWASHNGPRAVGGEPKNDLVTFNWRPTPAGQPLTKAANTQLMHAFTDAPVHVSASDDGKLLVIRERTKPTDFYRLFRKDDVLDGNNKRVGLTISRARAGAPVQGFAVVDDLLFIYLGAARERTWVEVHSFTTGKKLNREYDITDLARRPGDPADVFLEAEGAKGTKFMIKRGVGPARSLVVYEMPAAWWQ